MSLPVLSLAVIVFLVVFFSILRMGSGAGYEVCGLLGSETASGLIYKVDTMLLDRTNFAAA